MQVGASVTEPVTANAPLELATYDGAELVVTFEQSATQTLENASFFHRTGATSRNVAGGGVEIGVGVGDGVAVGAAAPTVHATKKTYDEPARVVSPGAEGAKTQELARTSAGPATIVRLSSSFEPTL